MNVTSEKSESLALLANALYQDFEIAARNRDNDAALLLRRYRDVRRDLAITTGLLDTKGEYLGPIEVHEGGESFNTKVYSTTQPLTDFPALAAMVPDAAKHSITLKWFILSAGEKAWIGDGGWCSSNRSDPNRVWRIPLFERLSHVCLDAEGKRPWHRFFHVRDVEVDGECRRLALWLGDLRGGKVLPPEFRYACWGSFRDRQVWLDLPDFHLLRNAYIGMGYLPSNYADPTSKWPEHTYVWRHSHMEALLPVYVALANADDDHLLQVMAANSRQGMCKRLPGRRGEPTTNICIICGARFDQEITGDYHHCSPECRQATSRQHHIRSMELERTSHPRPREGASAYTERRKQETLAAGFTWDTRQSYDTTAEYHRLK